MMMIFPRTGNNLQKGGSSKLGNLLRWKILCKIQVLILSIECTSVIPRLSTVPTNAALSPTKKRGPGRPQKYPEPNDRAAAGNIQQNLQVSVTASLIQADNFDPV